jgi:putative component of membrane protein insertase Oxa1/YidC/SpoIIIJ protein YidD
MEAVERYGVVVGGVKAIWRLLRCHPFAKGGYDPAAKSADARATASASGEFCSH